MADFRYRAIDVQGKVRKGTLFAFDEADVERRLESRGQTLVDAKRKSDRAFLSRSATGGKVPRRMLIELYHRLAQTLELGLPMLAALDENARVLPSKPLRAILSEMRVAIEGGNSLHSAMERFPAVFSRFDLSIIKLGERSGVLPKRLEELALFLEWKEEITGLIRRASIYPAFIFVAITAVIGVWIGYVLPQMASVLNEMGITLPEITKHVLALSQFVTGNWIKLGAAALSTAAAIALVSRTPRGRVLLHRALLRVPIVGNIAGKIAFTRLSRNFATMYESGMPLASIFELLCDDVLGNSYLEDRLGATFEEIQHGRSLAEGMEAAGGFPTLLVGAVRNGETTGTLGRAFNRLSDYYDAEVKKAVASLLAAVEPITITLLGGVFGIIILSILLPLYDVISEVGKTY